MATTRIHTCTYFDDGDVELLCVCGARRLYLVEEDGEPVLVALLDEDADVTLTSTRDEFAISA